MIERRDIKEEEEEEEEEEKGGREVVFLWAEKERGEN